MCSNEAIVYFRRRTIITMEFIYIQHTMFGTLSDQVLCAYCL